MRNQELIRTEGQMIYCDGAAEPNPGNGGWGFVVYQDGMEVHSKCGGSPHATNNQMELTGMLRALEWLSKPANRKFTIIYCDSAYVVDGCNIWRHGWKKKGWQRKGKGADPENRVIANLNLWQAIDALLSANGGVKIQWVRGHVGTLGNERADELSLQGMAENSRLDMIKQQLAAPL